MVIVTVSKAMSKKFNNSMCTNASVSFVSVIVKELEIVYTLDAPDFFSFPEYAKVTK